MKWFTTIVLSVFISTGFSKDLTRSVVVSFAPNCNNLNDDQIELIINEYLEVSPGDWLIFKTVTSEELKANKLLAIKNSKKRNRLITDFLLSNGLLSKQFKRMYTSYECLWVNKPQSCALTNTVKPKSAKQSIRFKNSEGGSLFTEAGRTFVFKPMSFDAFSTDEITVVVSEYVNKQDFVKHGVTAMGTKGQLESKGMYFVEAFVNANPVKLRRNANYQLKIPNSGETKGFYAYYGQEKNGELIWRKNDREPFLEEASEEKDVADAETRFEGGTASYSVDTVFVENEDGELISVLIASVFSPTDQLVGHFSGLGWINCDRFYESGTKVEAAFVLNRGASQVKFSAYMIFHDINSVLPLYSVTNGTFKSPLIPLGAEVTVLFIENSTNSTVQYAYQKLKIGNESKINLSTSPVLMKDLEKSLLDIVY